MPTNWPKVTLNLVTIPNTGMAAAAKAEQKGYLGATALFIHLVQMARNGGQPEYDQLALFLSWAFTIAEVGPEERITALQRLAEYELPSALALTVAAALSPPPPPEEP